MLNNPILHSLVLFAQKEAEKGEVAWWQSPMIPFLLVMLAFMYFMFIVPERQRRKQQQNLFSSLKKNDKVVTIGGVIGVISFIDEKSDEVTLRLDEGKMKILKSSIARILGPEEQASTDTNIKK